jgi:PIN domain nuclease of toxin-antitoxin system
MIVGVADTHVAIWYLYDDPRLSRAASDFIDRAVQSGSKIAISSISLIEIVYLVEKLRLPQEVYSDLRAALVAKKHVFVELPVNVDVSNSMRLIPRETIPDMPDRIIAATALSLEVPLLSRDSRIHNSNLHLIW